MRHILSFYDQISCSETNTQQSSPEHPSTVQKTVKRTQQASISTKKKSRGHLNERGTSQEQTTSKKVPTSVSRVAVTGLQSKNTENVVLNQVKETQVVTPNKNSMPKAQSKHVQSSRGNNSDKTTQPVAAHKTTRTASGMQGIQRSVTKNDLSSNKDDSRYLKSIESRADSQPSKKTHTLTKQDSSVYLKGNAMDKALNKRPA